MSAAQHTPERPNPMAVTVKGREYAVYFHHATGEPHCVETTVRMQGVPIAGRRLSMHGPTARAAIAKATGSAS